MADDPKNQTLLDVSNVNTGEQLASAMIGAFLALLGIRGFCKIVSIFAELTSGWIRPMCYREGGERNLRLWPFFYFVAGPVAVGAAAFLQRWHSPLGSIVAIWALGFGVAEWLSARDRRRNGVYVYSRFLGVPRGLPVSAYNWQPAIPLVIGAALLSSRYDVPTGTELVVVAVGMWMRLWAIAAVRHEDALDMNDARWLADYQSQAAQELDRAERVRSYRGVAQAATTIDLVRRMSTGL